MSTSRYNKWLLIGLVVISTTVKAGDQDIASQPGRVRRALGAVGSLPGRAFGILSYLWTAPPLPAELMGPPSAHDSSLVPLPLPATPLPPTTPLPPIGSGSITIDLPQGMPPIPRIPSPPPATGLGSDVALNAANAIATVLPSTSALTGAVAGVALAKAGSDAANVLAPQIPQIGRQAGADAARTLAPALPLAGREAGASAAHSLGQTIAEQGRKWRGFAARGSGVIALLSFATHKFKSGNRLRHRGLREKAKALRLADEKEQKALMASAEFKISEGNKDIAAAITLTLQIIPTFTIGKNNTIAVAGIGAGLIPVAVAYWPSQTVPDKITIPVNNNP